MFITIMCNGKLISFNINVKEYKEKDNEIYFPTYEYYAGRDGY